MNRVTVDKFLIVLPIVMLALVQILLKGQAVAAADARLEPLNYLRALLVSPWIWLAGAMSVAALVAWLLILGRQPLSYAYPFVSLTFPLVAVLSWVAFDERINGPQLLGLVFIVAGVILNAHYGQHGGH